MKKILALILMAAITLPVAAKEVTLKCSLTWKSTGKSKDSEIWILDEANGTVTRDERKISVKTDCNDKDHRNLTCWSAFITPTKFGHIFYFYKPEEGKDRTDGSPITITRDGEYVDEPSTIGTCSVFKPAF